MRTKAIIRLLLILIPCILTITTCSKRTSSTIRVIESCNDGILNQDEKNIDCGGVCLACASCTDGIQNQGEAGIDCGGPCPNCSVSYFASGVNGGNILRHDTITIKSEAGITPQPRYFYSLQAQLPPGTTLRLKLKNLSPGNWNANLASSSGWTSDGYKSGIQEFNATGQTNCDMRIYFIATGNAVIEFYENGVSTPTRVKNLNWKP